MTIRLVHYSDVETFGNHDFDFGTEPIRGIAADSPQEWIVANLYESEPGGDPEDRFAGASPTTVLERGGRRVGVVGVIDPATPRIAAGAAELTVTDPVEAVRSAVDDLRDDVDHVVVLSHLRTDLETDVANVDGVDAVLGGHVHSERHETVDETRVVRPGANGQVVWEVELPDDGPPTATRHATADGPIDESVADALRDRMAEFDLLEVVATVEDPIHRDLERRTSGESRVGNLVADAYRWAGDADVGFVHNGGLREGRPLSGEVTAGEVASVAPFGGAIYVLDVEGEQLRNLLDTGFRPYREDDAIWHCDVSGTTVEYDPEDGQLEDISVGGDPLDPDETYRLATNAYVAYSDVFPLPREAAVDSFGLQFEVLADYAREVGIDVELEGRLTEV